MAVAAGAVREQHARYSGETRFPLIRMNAHRYFFCLAAVILVINVREAGQAFRGPTVVSRSG